MRLLSLNECQEGASANDGFTFSIQQDLRAGSYNCIVEMGYQLKLNQNTVSIAIYLFNFFFIKKSFLNYDRHLVASAALFLAGKITNEIRKVRDICIYYHKIQNKLSQQFAAPFDETVYLKVREKVFDLEFELLKVLNFDLEVNLPQDYKDQLLQKLQLDQLADFNKTEKFKLSCDCFLSECLRTIAPLCFEPQTVAIACILLAAAANQIDLQHLKICYLDNQNEQEEGEVIKQEDQMEIEGEQSI